MIVENYQQLPITFTSAQVTIVGAGAVGLALGLSLSRMGLTTLILEAGDRSPPSDYQTLNRGSVSGKPHKGLKTGRMVAYGGTTRLWGGQLVGFGRLDFGGVPEAGLPAWPVTYSEIEPYLDRAFDFLGVGPEGRDQDAILGKFLGKHLNLGDNLKVGMNIWLPQPDFTRLFSQELENSKLLCILTNAPVSRLLFDESGRRVSAVRLSNPLATEIPVRRLVLANGTLEINSVLLRAAAAYPDGALSRLSRIGKGFIDHIHGIAGRVIVEDAKGLSALTDNVYFQKRKYGIKIRLADHFRKRAGVSNCAATINAAITPRMLLYDLVTLAKRLSGGKARDISAFIRQTAVMTRVFSPLLLRYFLQRRAGSLLSRGVYLGLELEQLPTARSLITLEADAAPDKAEINLNWEFSGREMEAAATLCEELDKSFRRSKLGYIEIDPRILARDPAFLDSCHDSNHHIGGAAMGSSADDGVVDHNNQVFGCENLFVTGAATFPSGSFANPTLTAIAFALRLAEKLKASC